MGYGGRYITCFNPKILFSSPQKSAMSESCLSYGYELSPNMRPAVNVMRPKTIKVEYQDENNKVIVIKLRGLEAKCFQHELDHLNGITIFYRNK
jgi:peptide deformylase